METQRHEAMVKSRNALVGTGLLVCALALGGESAACSTSRELMPDDASAARGHPAQTVQQVPQARQVSQAFVGIAERLAPSVVRITTRQRSPSPASLSREGTNPFEGTPFEFFFEDFGRTPQDRGPRTGLGSGVVIDDQGHILTNNHVVAHADDLRVTFIDGKELQARVVGVDPKTDLAVVKVDGATVKPAEFGDAEAMRVGEWVMAIGNPFGLDHSVTIGVLSAKGRHGFASDTLEDFLQTDASINPGNSGGPLVNLSGKVIGINTMIAGLGTGVGFAVSESIARPVANALIKHGKVTRPYIGIAMQTLTPELRDAIGEGVPDNGALVSHVEGGSPADKAGIEVGDVVVRVGGRGTADSHDVQRTVLEQKVGDKVNVTVWRDGKEVEIGVVTSELPTEPIAARKPGRPEDRLGLGLRTLTPELAARSGYDRATRGAIVTAIRPGSVAAEAGLRERDVIVAIDGGQVASAADAARQMSKSRPGGHLARVRRGEASFFVAIPNSRAED